MINERMRQLGKHRSEIRELFEYGLKRKREIGKENVCDFSLGNPSVPAPSSVNDGIRTLISQCKSTDLHAYTSAAGDLAVRQAVAEYITKSEDFAVTGDNLYMTVGAAAALSVTLGAVVSAGDEVIVLAPYFPEYKVFIETAGARCVEVMTEESSFRPDIAALGQSINDRTAAVIVNSPNNPTGVVYSESDIKALRELLSECEEKFGHAIYLISDEPYRELVYGGVRVPFIPKYYKDTIVCYSYSKSLSIPGERIGYVLVPNQVTDSADVYAAVAGAGRALGYVCAPSLLQKLLPYCLGTTADVSIYDKNRLMLYEALTEYGYTVVKPDGAFYLFVKSPSGDGREFSERAKKKDMLIVASDSFGAPGYVRISYCVENSEIIKALPKFKEMAVEYRL